MIFKLRKNFYEHTCDYPLKNTLGETVCKIAVLDQGYYIYNKLGIQLGQIVFEGGEAIISVVKSKASFPGAIRVRLGKNNSILFVANEMDKEDERFISLVKGEKPLNFSIWGKPFEYSYDIYEGNTLFANIVPSSTNKCEYNLRTNDDTNLLYVLLICLATEKILQTSS